MGVLKEKDLKQLALFLTVHAYRNSPIEDIHAEGRLSQEDMKRLNRAIANKMYTLLYAMEEGILFNNEFYGSNSWWSDWDEPELDMEEIQMLRKLSLDNSKAPDKLGEC